MTGSSRRVSRSIVWTNASTCTSSWERLSESISPESFGRLALGFELNRTPWAIAHGENTAQVFAAGRTPPDSEPEDCQDQCNKDCARPHHPSHRETEQLAGRWIGKGYRGDNQGYHGDTDQSHVPEPSLFGSELSENSLILVLSPVHVIRRQDQGYLPGDRPDATQSDGAASRESKPSWRVDGASDMRGFWDFATALVSTDPSYSAWVKIS